MALWTDIIDPASLTGYVRAALDESQKGSLARWLPNTVKNDNVFRFYESESGLVDIAKFRAYDAEIEVGKRKGGKRKSIELPALGQNIPVSEYDQLRARGNVTDELALAEIKKVGLQVVTAVSEAMELMRGIVLATGKATIDQDNYQSDDNFGRPVEHTFSAATLWSSSTDNALQDLEIAADLYRDATGEEPGAFVMGSKEIRALQAAKQFQTALINGASRPASIADINGVLDAQGLPVIERYDRRVSVDGTVQRVIPEGVILVLPAPGAETGEAKLGTSVWGRTLSADEPSWGIEDSDKPGIVAGVYRGEKPPFITEVLSDAIGLPVLQNGKYSVAMKVR